MHEQSNKANQFCVFIYINKLSDTKRIYLVVYLWWIEDLFHGESVMCFYIHECTATFSSDVIGV